MQADTGTSTTSVIIPNNATLDVKDTSYMIAEGDIEVGDFAGKDTATIKKNMAGYTITVHFLLIHSASCGQAT